MGRLVTARGQAPSSGARVLVVDDQHANLLAVEAILEPLGHRLVLAASGDEALRRLLREEFALILLDVQMPGMNGLETATLIRGPERTRHIPIIFLTAVSRDAQHVFEGYQRGAVDYLLKPIEPEVLRSKVSVFVDLYLRGEKIKRQAALLVENARLYEAERTARATAEAATRAREDTLAVVSHDLRTPLSTISLGAQVMRAGMPDTEEYAQHRQNAAAILRAAECMTRLVNDLLDVSRMEAGSVSLEKAPLAVDALISQAVETAAPLASSRGQRLTVENEAAGLLVSCDAGRISQVFSNLLGNAIKFAPPDGDITVGVRRAGEMLEFWVADHGPGITPEQLPHIFDRHWQARAANREGVGLGLAIAKGIVESHGGAIRVASSGAGTTFTFTIPAVAGDGDHRAPTATAASP